MGNKIVPVNHDLLEQIAESASIGRSECFRISKKLSAKRLWNILPNIDWRRLLTIYPIPKKAFRRFVFPVGSTAPVISGKSLKTTAACPPVSIDDL